MNPLFPALHESNLEEFNRLIAEAEDFDETPKDGEEATPSPGQIEENDVFTKVKQNNEMDVDTNAYAFLGRDESGSFTAMNDITNERDPAVKGLTTVITGCILRDSDSAIEFVTALFNACGINDISPEDFEKVKGTIWKKLEDLTVNDPVSAYSTFEKFVVSIVNGLRDNVSASIDGTP